MGRAECRNDFFTDTDSGTVCRDVAWTVLWRTDRNSGTSFQFCTDRDATGAEGLFYVCGVDGIRDCDRMDDLENKCICKSPYGNDFRESGVWYFLNRGSAVFAYTGALPKSGGIFIGDCLRSTGNADSDCDSSGIVPDVKARRSDI